jgi:ABC-type nitrate/sulfonate/bicarbonate transport system substrate-binding protein
MRMISSDAIEMRRQLRELEQDADDLVLHEAQPLGAAPAVFSRWRSFSSRQVEDLKGKRVAVTRGTDPHIFLVRALLGAG